MRIQTCIKLFSGKIITESRLNNDTKIQLLNYIKESNIFEVLDLLLDGEIKNNHNKKETLKRFKESNLPSKIKYFMKEDVPYLGTVADYSDAYRSQRISNNYKDCINDCENLEGKEKQICKSNCKINAYESVIDELRNGLRNCQYREEPENCTEKLNKLIEKLEEKVNKQSEKIEKYREELRQE